MPSAKTEITEITTGLGTLGFADLDTALRARPPEMANVTGEQWDRLDELWADRRHRSDFAAAWANGIAFLRSPDALRGRPPRLVEWRGPRRDPAEAAVPADLRIDHVYLVSCKYLSKILINASPAHLFDGTLRGDPSGAAGIDWYQQVAPDGYQRLYEVVRSERPWLDLPPFALDLLPAHRARLRDNLRGGWSDPERRAYRAMGADVARASVDRWRASLARKADRTRMLWRLLRLAPAPYFVLGTAADRCLRLRIATPWDWRERFELDRFDVWAEVAGQPTVRWSATVRDRREGSGTVTTVRGHVEIRWSHGRFAKPPEAKVYLDTPHHLVPGYLTIA